MRLKFLTLLLGLILLAPASWAATGRIIKVLPHFLDSKGRVALSPSLFDRDAYQARLRAKKELRAGLRYSVQWKSRKESLQPLRIEVQLRGTAEGNLPKERLLKKEVKPSGWPNKWTHLDLVGQDFKDFGEVTAWRVTLWEGDNLLGEQKSFLW